MKFISYFKSAWALLVAIVLSITAFISPTPKPTDVYEIISEQHYALDSSIPTGQGIAYDEHYYYTSGALAAFYLTGLAKINKTTNEIVKTNLNALPTSFIKEGYDHIGGIGVYNGLIYAAVEDRKEEKPLVLTFSCDTLEYTGNYYNMQVFEKDSNGNNIPLLSDGIPWCAVDSDNGYLYTAQFHNTPYILVYNIEDMSFSHKIELSKELHRVQDCAYLEGKLYANCDPKKQDKEVYIIDMLTGETELLFTRETTGYDCETEGIAVFKDSDGSNLFLITDYDKLVSVFFRTYRLK